MFTPYATNTDARGNVLLLSKHSDFKIIRISLKLNGKKERTLGDIDVTHKVIYMRRDSSKHYMYKLQAYGFNYEVMKTEGLYERVCIQVYHKDKNSYSYYNIPREVLLKKGEVKNFSGQGFELQTFLRASIMEEYRTDDKYGLSQGSGNSVAEQATTFTNHKRREGQTRRS